MWSGVVRTLGASFYKCQIVNVARYVPQTISVPKKLALHNKNAYVAGENLIFP